MSNSVLKTVSLTLAVLSVASLSGASERKVLVPGADASVASARLPLEIEIGWQRIESSLAARSAAEAPVPGAIILPPFENFAPYRADLPPAVAAAWEASVDAKGLTTQARPGGHD